MEKREFTTDEIRNLLELIEKTKKNSDIIFSSLFYWTEIDRSYIDKVLGSISFEGIPLFQYIEREVMYLDQFSKCKRIKCSGSDIVVYYPGLNYKEEMRYMTENEIYDLSTLTRDNENISAEEILIINANKKTFRISLSYEKNLRRKMNAEIEEKHAKLDSFWENVQNLTWKKRVQNAFNTFDQRRMPFHMKIIDFFLWLSYPKNKLEEKYREEQIEIAEKNRQYEKEYIYNLAKRGFYQKHGEEYIGEMKAQQKEIADYLIKQGYTEVI